VCFLRNKRTIVRFNDERRNTLKTEAKTLRQVHEGTIIDLTQKQFITKAKNHRAPLREIAANPSATRRSVSSLNAILRLRERMVQAEQSRCVRNTKERWRCNHIEIRQQSISTILARAPLEQTRKNDQELISFQNKRRMKNLPTIQRDMSMALISHGVDMTVGCEYGQAINRFHRGVEEMTENVISNEKQFRRSRLTDCSREGTLARPLRPSCNRQIPLSARYCDHCSDV
jgi:hypothetical protein